MLKRLFGLLKPKSSSHANPHNLKFVNHDFRQNSDAFMNLVSEIMAKHQFDEIVESGTALGDGSTRIFAQYNIPIKTIECNKANYEQAVQNLAEYDHVELFHALTLDKAETAAFIEADRLFLENPGDIYSDSADPVSFYLHEINQDVPEDNKLIPLISNNKKQLVFLDSAGGIGYLEFLKVMESEYLGSKVVLLDDVDHVKHHRSVQYLEERGYTLVMSSDERSCYCDFTAG